MVEESHSRRWHEDDETGVRHRQQRVSGALSSEDTSWFFANPRPEMVWVEPERRPDGRQSRHDHRRVFAPVERQQYQRQYGSEPSSPELSDAEDNVFELGYRRRTYLDRIRRLQYHEVLGGLRADETHFQEPVQPRRQNYSVQHNTSEVIPRTVRQWGDNISEHEPLGGLGSWLQGHERPTASELHQLEPGSGVQPVQEWEVYGQLEGEGADIFHFERGEVPYPRDVSFAKVSFCNERCGR